MRKLLLTLIKGYQVVLSPIMGNSCRFYPTCSCYAHTAIDRYGPIRGMYMATRRILRCHPWHPGGMDPVPELKNEIKKK